MNFRAYEHELLAIVRGSTQLMSALHTARTLALPTWCIGAGAVRNLVWDHLHNISSQPSNDIDLVYFDSSGTSELNLNYQEKLTKLAPEFDWDVTNQAYVHTWYNQPFGFPAPPLGLSWARNFNMARVRNLRWCKPGLSRKY